MAVNGAIAQGEDIVLQSGNYDRDPYPGYNTSGSERGTYTIQVAKSAHTFTAGQFTINVAFPPGAVYAGGGTIPSEFTVTQGADGSSAVVISITGDWAGTGPTAIRTLVLPIKIIDASDDQPTATALQWADPFVTENPAGNSTGSPLNVLDWVMPVELQSFTVSKEGMAVNLAWTTTEETNASHFEVQRSADAKTWQKIGRVDASGESKVNVNYSFADSSPLSGTNYYRLKMVDNDATFSFSKIRNVEMEKRHLVIYPNPATNVMFLDGVDASKVKSISIHNNNGQTVYAASKMSPAGIDVSRLPIGTYLVCTRTLDGVALAQRIMIAR